MNTKSEKEKNGAGMWFRAVRSAVIASAVSVALVAAFAFALAKQWLGVEIIEPVNIALKLLCAALSAWLTVRRCSSRAWLWGAIGGGAYMALALAVFSLLSGEFSADTGLLADMGMCMLCGAIIGVIRNLKR